MYVVIMQGTTGEFRTLYKSRKKAEQAAKNIILLGYEARVEKINKNVKEVKKWDAKHT